MTTTETNDKKPTKASALKIIANILRKPITGSILAILAAALVGGVILIAAGHNPIQAYIGLFYGAVGQPRFIVHTIVASTALILTGLSVTFAYKTGLFNIGVEGQFIVGTIAAVFLGYFVSLPPVIHPIVVMLGAMLVAGVFGAIVGFLKARFNIHEVLSSIMLNWVAINLLNLYLGVEAFRRTGSNSAHSIQNSASIILFHEMKRTSEGIAQLRESEILSELVLRTDLNFGIFIAIATVLLAKFILDKTSLGYTLKAVGSNKDAAEFAGINIKRYMILSMFISGAIAGLAAAVHITGVSPNTITMLGGFQNFGFNGIPVALLSNAAVIPNIFSALLFGGMNYGSGYIQSRYQIPTETIDIMIGLIVFFVALRAICIIIADKIELRKGVQ
ncbi:MAG: ABC transporter permease [Defluviitaleaceae bacterium]|nr:ABC transporter permease [Defluviitaleaceae bacterium]